MSGSLHFARFPLTVCNFQKRITPAAAKVLEATARQLAPIAPSYHKGNITALQIYFSITSRSRYKSDPQKFHSYEILGAAYRNGYRA